MNQKPIFQFKKEDKKNLEFVRQIVLYRLKKDDEWHEFDYNWEPMSQHWVSFENRNVQDQFLLLANEVMWQLIIQGVITVGQNSNNPYLPKFRITDYGRKVSEEERFIPHDPTNYLSELNSLDCGLLDEITISYIEESLRCFHSGCSIASVLLLGIAAESIFLRLCRTIQDSLPNDSDKKKLDEKIPVKTKHRWIVKRIESLPNKTKKELLPESLDTTLTSLWDLIRKQRNDLGHPQESPPKINREQAFVYFRLFPQFVTDLKKLEEFYKTRMVVKSSGHTSSV